MNVTILLCDLCVLFFLHIYFLEYSSSGESDKYNKEESDELGSESRSSGTFGIGLGGFLHGVGLPLGVTISDGELCYGDGGSLVP